ncbi:MAG TPA: hypothetical protein PLQ81_04050 [bacterium]|nr:hypothetical protein [bacterium]
MNLNIMKELSKKIKENTNFSKNKFDAGSPEYGSQEFKFDFSFAENREFYDYMNFTGIPVVNRLNKRIFLFNISNSVIREQPFSRIIENIPDEELLFMMHYEFLRFDILNPVVLSELIKYYCELSKTELETVDFLKFVEVKPVKENLDFYIKLASSDKQIKLKIVQTQLSKDIIELLVMFSKTEQLYLLELIQKYNYSLNDKKQIINYIFDIVKSGKISFYEISRKIDELSEAKSGVNMKILEYLRQLRFPVLEPIRKKNDAVMRKLNGEHWKFEYDKNLEKKELICKLIIKNRFDAEKVYDELLKKKKIIDEFFYEWQE